MAEEVMELEIEGEPEEEEEVEKAPKLEGALPAGGVELRISLENPKIHIDKLTIKKRE